MSRGLSEPLNEYVCGRHAGVGGSLQAGISVYISTRSRSGDPVERNLSYVVVRPPPC